MIIFVEMFIFIFKCVIILVPVWFVNMLGGIVMANKYLGPIYKMLFDKDFKYNNFEQRLEMQKAIYLLQDMGVPVGNYGFRWYYYGPYSQALQDDMYFESSRRSEEITLSKEYMEDVLKLKQVIESGYNGKYSVTKWIECIASMHYLRENMMDFNTGEEDVVKELENRKDYLSDRDTNRTAYKLMESLFV